MASQSVARVAERLLLTGGRVVDPANGVDRTLDLLIDGGRIASLLEPGERAAVDGARRIDVRGRIVAPGFVDWHCHLREPGQEDRETFETGTRAAAAGGFTTVCAMANTAPPVDDRSSVEFVVAESRRRGVIRVLPIACVTKGQRGEELTEMAELIEAGAVAFSDDGIPIRNSRVFRHALEYGRMLGVPIVDHAEDPSLAGPGLMHEGAVSDRLGLPGNPWAAESIAVARDVELAALTNSWVHIAHLSTKRAVEIVRDARARGVQVTAEATPHHLVLTDAWAAGRMLEDRPLVDDVYRLLRPPAGRMPYDSNTRVAPPLRTAEDAQAVFEGLLDGTIDVVATDHAPHTAVDKGQEFGLAPCGISGIETAFASLMALVHAGKLPFDLLIRKLAWEPAELLRRRVVGAGLPAPQRIDPLLGSLAGGAPADVVVLDPDEVWTVDPDRFASKGHNSPLGGVALKGRVVLTLYGGAVVYGAPSET